MEKKGWKITAIIFIILFVIETAAFTGLMVIGLQTINTDTKCAVNICNNDQYNSYYYDSYDNICYCYTNGEIVHKEYMGK